MRAVQSSSTAVFEESGVWCRSDQFAALRYMSRHLETDVAVDVASGVEQDRLGDTSSPLQAKASTEAFGWDEFVCAEPMDWKNASVRDEPELAQHAAQLLLAMRFLHRNLADEAISFAEWTRYSTELESLRDRSWQLMVQFMTLAREPGRQNGTRSRTLRLEKGAAGWIAC